MRYHIFNKCLPNGVFPDGLKLAKVLPIKLMIDYQSQITYIFLFYLFFLRNPRKKIMYNRLLSFITASTILANNQNGYRESHSTYMALLIWQIKLETRQIIQFSMGLFIALSNACDGVQIIVSFLLVNSIIMMLKLKAPLINCFQSS